MRAVAYKESWAILAVDEQRGFLDQRARRSVTTGAKHIRASAGDYLGVPFVVNTSIFWGFDESGRLIDIWVWQTADAL